MNCKDCFCPIKRGEFIRKRGFILVLVFILSFVFSGNKEVNAQCYTAGQSMPNVGYFLRSSGYQDLDSLVFQEINNLQLFFGVKIDFFFLLEIYDKNAMYDPQCNYNCNGTVFLGIKMLYSQLQKEHGIECVKAILAHEFGHCVQFLMNWKENGKRPELHSDFMAGYYTGKMYNYSEEQVNSLFNEFYSIGDYNYWSIDHHGTKYERKCAFEEGYYFAKENYTTVSTANTYAIQYVMANNPCAVRKYIAKVQAYQNELERRKNQLENDVKNNNVGAITFRALDNKKYKIVTENGYGQQVIYPINQKYQGFNNKGQRVIYSPTNEVRLNPISANTDIPYRIYKTHWLLGDIPLYQFYPKICRNNTIQVSFSKSTHSINNLCP
jgi:hypothetical protein